MDDAKWERAAGAGGILFVVLVLISAFLPGSPPSTSDPAVKIAKYFADHDDAIRQASFLAIIATLPIVWWAAAIYRMLERATGNARLGVITAVGVAIATVAGGISAVVYAVVAVAGVGGSGGVSGTKFFYMLGTNMNAMVAIGTALAVGAVSAGILRTGMMAKWIGWLGGLVALLSVVGSLIAVSGNDVVMGVLFASFLVFALWLVIVSVVMLRAPQAVAEAV
jgi:hypothetical protein